MLKNSKKEVFMKKNILDELMFEIFKKSDFADYRTYIKASDTLLDLTKAIAHNALYARYGLEPKQVDYEPAKEAIRVLNSLCDRYNIERVFTLSIDDTSDICQFAAEAAVKPIMS